MKKFWALLLSICLLLCGAAFAADLDWEDEETEDLEVNFDMYNLDIEARLRLEEEDIFEEGAFVEAEYDGIGIIGHVGKTIGELLADSGYRNLQVISETEQFEGWMVYTQEIVIDEFGFENWEMQRYSEPGVYLTTEEVLALPMPEYSVHFIAKWASIAEEDYFQPTEYDLGEIGDLDWPNTLALSGNGGMMYLTESRDWEADYYEYMVEDGLTAVDAMTEEKVGDQIFFAVEKEGAELLGWNVYIGDSLEYGYDVPVDEFAMCFVHENPYDPEWNMYLMLTNCELYGENVPTEALWTIVLEDKSCYAVAQWSE